MTKTQVVEREAARTELRALLPPGSTVHTILRHLSRSGMQRHIDAYYIEGGTSHWLSHRVARATGLAFNVKRESISMGSCGMDMGFALVYELSAALYPTGFECIGDPQGLGTHRCPSNDHSNGDRDFTPHHHKDGGDALLHKWLWAGSTPALAPVGSEHPTARHGALNL